MKLYQLDYVNCDKWLLHNPAILTKPNHIQLLEACQAFRTSENAELVLVQYLQMQQEISSKSMMEAKNLRAKMSDIENLLEITHSWIYQFYLYRRFTHL